jgi:triosephosphate isomerase
MSRRNIVAGNWKMNLDRAKAMELAQAVAGRHAEAGRVELVLCPPSVYLATVGSAVGFGANGTSPSGVAVGAQNMHDKASGAFTGEIAPPMLVDIGCRFVILGHSERRTLFGETDATVNTKTKAALAAGLTPIVCVGEPLEVREAGEHVEHNLAQLRGSLAGLSLEQLSDVVIAYEPVWAIGTGRVAGPADAQEVCAAIRAELAQLASPAVAEGVRVLYGGSVNAKNIGEIVAQPDVDGALVGGASLDGEQFAVLSAIAAGGPLP